MPKKTLWSGTRIAGKTTGKAVEQRQRLEAATAENILGFTGGFTPDFRFSWWTARF